MQGSLVKETLVPMVTPWLNKDKYICAVVQGSGEEVEEIPLPEADTVEVIPGSQLLWRIAPRPENSIEVRHIRKHFCLDGWYIQAYKDAEA